MNTKTAMAELILSVMPSLEGMEIHPESNLKDDLGIDSLRIVEVLVKLEYHYGITFNESDLHPENLKKVKDLERLVDKYLNGGVNA